MRNLVKSMLLAALLVAGVSCEKRFEEAVEVQSENHAAADVVTSYEVSYEEALAKADALFAGIDGATTRAGNRRVKNHELFCSGNRLTRTASDDAEAKFHIINYEDNAGFAMIAADKRATDIYAYSDTGNLYVDDAMKNSGFGVFMEGAIELYKNEIASPMSILPDDSLIITPRPGLNGEFGDIPDLPLVKIDNTFYLVRYGAYTTSSSKRPLVPVKWHQANPYNYYCSSCSDYVGTNYYGRCAAGCGPVAAAQIMAYHKHPASYSGYIFDWDNMLQNFNMWKDKPNDESLMVAYLIREIGRAAKADYGKETGVTLANIKKMFPKFGYNITGADYDVDKVKISLDNNRPVYARGQTKSGDGHAWVIDGYDYQVLKNIYYNAYEPYNIAWVDIIGQRTYVHCNWGWSSETYNKNTEYYNNAYFLSGAFVVTRKNSDGSEKTFDYTKKNKIIYNIYPKQ